MSVWGGMKEMVYVRLNLGSCGVSKGITRSKASKTGLYFGPGRGWEYVFFTLLRVLKKSRIFGYGLEW